MSTAPKTRSGAGRAALGFVLTMGVLSFFSDFTHEGARSIIGPYLGAFGLGAFAIGAITGFGQLVNYGFRLVSGRFADRTRAYWPIAIFGYVLQMLAVPALALTQTWQTAAILIVLERLGRSIRNPPRDAMLSHAAERIGFGWAFGMHEALDQLGAMIGPLSIAALMAWRQDYRLAFACLLVPALLNLSLVLVARRIYPRPDILGAPASGDEPASSSYPPAFHLYLLAGALVAAGFADYPIIAYHFGRVGSVAPDVIPVFYAVAMGVGGAGSLALGRLFDRFGFPLLVGLTFVTAAYAPLVFAGGTWAALAGAILWGLGMGVHESIIPAAVAPMVAGSRRASAFGLFTSVYGLAWFAGSALIGLIYDQSPDAAAVFCVAVELAAMPLLIMTAKAVRSQRSTKAGP